MITATQSPTDSTASGAQVTRSHQGNPHIEHLRDAFGAGKSTWAVLADDDHILVRQLSAALANQPSAVLPVPQRRWQADNAVTEAVAWSAGQPQVTTLVLVGNSAVGRPFTEPVVIEQDRGGGLKEALQAQIRLSEQ